MIAMALSCDPSILIADEPTTALDVTTQAQILALLERLQEERGMAIMLITHNLGVVAEMCDDVVVMYLGRVVEKGPVGADLPRRQTPVHAGAAALDPQHRCGAQSEVADDHRRHPASLQPSEGLPLPPALPAGDARFVRCADADPAAGQGRGRRRAAFCMATSPPSPPSPETQPRSQERGAKIGRGANGQPLTGEPPPLLGKVVRHQERGQGGEVQMTAADRRTTPSPGDRWCVPRRGGRGARCK